MSQNQKLDCQIENKYQIIKKLGSGAYGHVWKVKQKLSQKIFALKKIFQAFQNATDAQRTFRQISILKKIEHKNIIKLYQVFSGRNKRDVYLVFQYMQTDLYRALYQDILQPIHKKYIVYQMLIAVYYIHSTGIIHRDLKPSNILLNASCEVKICDFGLARCLNSKNKQNDQILTEGVATRWYRSPQVLLGSNFYDEKADIWSMGCIIAQLLLKNPIFPGGSTINQLQRIIQFTGKPTLEDIQSIKCQYAQNFVSQCNQIKLKSPKQYFGNQSQGKCVDLIYKILQFNPKKRISIQQILAHEYFQQFHSQNDVIASKKKIQLEASDNKKLSTSEYQNLIQQFQTNKKQKSLVNRPSSACSYKQNGGTKSPIRTQSKENSNMKQNQKFNNINKIRQASFGKLLSQSKIKARSQSNEVKQPSKNLHLFSQIIKNKDSERKRKQSQQKKPQSYKKTHLSKGKQNIHSNIFPSNNNNLDLKRFESTTRSRISFQGLKKTMLPKFNK